MSFKSSISGRFGGRKAVGREPHVSNVFSSSLDLSTSHIKLQGQEATTLE
jgi:hypothetical protein